ncbi:CPBP family glutamic-type intramembrane protease [Desulfuribacillus alkaliarsenatis]|uniref:CPBP family glutamic-type intramembrane protease n=1 Tax=Desulfuribacillus alkaliarsenatis TaxID=766136 RepID=UPI0009FBED1C|nr:CPBP family glutamic-type intramembrane protease [Desulfuribacillus alkaliarsenatis]
MHILAQFDAHTGSDSSHWWFYLSAINICDFVNALLLGLIISSLIFGLFAGYSISATIMGFVLVILYKITNSIIPSMVLHALWNLTVVIMIT